SLVIVESPSKAKTINKYLGKDFTVEASVGHIIDLPKSKIGVDIKNGFKPQYVTISGKKQIIDTLKAKAAKADTIYIATDPDREGEAIAWHIENALKDINGNVYRINFNEITKSAVAKALENPGKINTNLVESQQARRILDRIVGFKVSPFLWKSIFRGLSAGRVQSVALRLICEREAAINAFKPEEFWSFKGLFNTADKKEVEAKLEKIDGKKLDVPNQAEAETHFKAISASQFTISKLESKELKRKPQPPFITSTMQQDAVRKLRMTAKRVMGTAQALYEGVTIGKHGQVGLITYMRTDSTRISNEAMDAVRSYIGEHYATDYLPEKPNFYKSKKSAQDAHEAIRPSYISYEFSPAAVKTYLTKDQHRLYELIWNRFVASQMTNAVFDKTTLEISDDRYTFKTVGEVQKFAGFLAVYEMQKADDEENLDIPPGLKLNESMQLKHLDKQQNFTKPPARYTESSIIKELDELGIGRPSTYAQIISTILDRKYVESVERKLQATEIGMTVNDVLVKHFPQIFNVQFTANMESQLDNIESQQSRYEEVLSDFYNPFEKLLDDANAKSKEIKSSLQEKTDVICDVCGKPMIIKMSRNGKFLACSGYPDCKNTKPIGSDGKTQEVEVSEYRCEKDNGRMLVKTGPYGKYLACENYPECKSTRPIPSGISCPKCGDGEVQGRRSRKGRIFYGCTNYPNCDFISWNPIANQDCPNKDSNYMIKKFTKAKGEHLQCPVCKEEVLIKQEVED
ncbi:MAG: type I DNA topoisomerase, partial [Calditrichaeota bacterium]|nr:type I DNA topoisomerase [Calditrichota bacterium]